MKVKTSEAKDQVLNYLVAKCEGATEEWRSGAPFLWDGVPCIRMYGHDVDYTPSTDWELGGPIIERERIATWFERYEDEDAGLPCWFAAKYGEREYPGPTLLIAGMRCYVASKLGDKVEVPDELMEV